MSLKLNRVKLKNFIGLYTNTGLTEIEIDFTKMTTNICLLVGGIGSGKTTLLSSIHPKAYNGKLDDRSGLDIIIKDKNGEKYLEYENDDFFYEIHHFYDRKTTGSITVSSYIKKISKLSGETIDLNPSGTQGTFNEIVSIELGFNDKLLEFIRMGSNVTSMMDRSASDRKKSISDILDELNIFIDRYKNASINNRNMKSLLKSVSEKMNKLETTNIFNLEDNIQILNNKISDYNDNLVNMKAEQLKLTQEISNANGLMEKYNENESKLKNLNRRINSIENTIKNKYNDISGISEDIMNLKKNELDTLKNDNSITLSNISSTQMMLDDLGVDDSVKIEEYSNELEILQSTLDKYKSDVEDILNEYKLDILFSEKNNMYNLQDLIMGKDTLLSVKNMLTNIAISDKDLQSYYDIMKKFNNVDNLTQAINSKFSNMNDIDELISEKKTLLTKVTITYEEHQNTLNKKPKECKIDNCFFLTANKDNVWTKKQIDDLEDEINRLSKKKFEFSIEIEMLKYIKSIDESIEYILQYISEHDILEVLPYYELFDSKKSIIRTISTGLNDLYKVDNIHNIISVLTERDRYLDLTKKLIPEVEKSIKVITDMINSRNVNTDNLKKYKCMLDELKTTHDNNLIKIDTLEKELDRINNMLLYREDMSNLITERDEIVVEQNTLQLQVNLVNSMEAKLEKINMELQFSNSELSRLQESLDNLKYTRRDLISLEKEKKELEQKLVDIEAVVKAFSVTKGMPVKFIEGYLQTTRYIANELAEICFGDRIYFEPFVVGEKEFRIPININGSTNADIKYVSQGERRLLTAIFNFALIRQNIDMSSNYIPYNILLMDEPDGSLDDDMRKRFMNMMEIQMEKIQSNLCILISHNTELRSGNCDVIILSEKYKSEFNNHNILYSV